MRSTAPPFTCKMACKRRAKQPEKMKSCCLGKHTRRQWRKKEEEKRKEQTKKNKKEKKEKVGEEEKEEKKKKKNRRSRRRKRSMRAQPEESPAKGPRRRWETAFTCSDRPTAEYCRRLVVMETGRQSRLLTELRRNEAPPPQPQHSSFHSSLPPRPTQNRHRKPVGGNLQVGFLQPETKTGSGRFRWTRVHFNRRDGGRESVASPTRV